MDHAAIAGVTFDLRREPEFLLRRQPGRIARPVGQVENADDAENNRRRTLQDEKPLPSGDAEGAIQIQDGAGNQRTENIGDRHRVVEHRIVAGAIGEREPEAQEQHHAGEQARFRKTEEAAKRIQAPWPLRERHQHGGNSPQDGDARQRHPCPVARQNQIARNLEDRIGEVHDADGDAEHLRVEAEIPVHRNGSE